MRYLNEIHQKVLKENVKLYILRFLHLPLINTAYLLPAFPFDLPHGTAKPHTA